MSIRQDEQSGRLTGAELRIRRNQCEQLKRRLHDVLSLFNDSQHDYKRRVSSKLLNDTTTYPFLCLRTCKKTVGYGRRIFGQ